MSQTKPARLIFFCGKMGSGKSTTAQHYTRTGQGLLIAEDAWLDGLYAGDIVEFEDYIQYSRRLRATLQPHIVGLLKAGLDIILDFPANTLSQRKWFMDIIQQSDCQHQMMYLESSDATCLARLNIRREQQPQRAQFDREDVFRAVTSYFQAPSAEEGFNIKRMPQD